MSARPPFNRLLTWWKPSHFFTGLEWHSREESWRSFRDGDTVVVVKATATGNSRVSLDLFADHRLPKLRFEQIIERVRLAYGLDEDLRPFLRQLREAQVLHPAEFGRLAGMRQSCPESIFEIAIIAMILQNTTVARSKQMIGSLLDEYGIQVKCENGPLLKAFFTPAELSAIPEATLRAVNRLGYRSPYAARFAEAFGGEGAGHFSMAEPAQLTDRLLRIHGVGPYTAGVIASSALRDPSTFGVDVWNRPILSSRLCGSSEASADEVRAAYTEKFGRYAGLAALYVVENHFLDAPVVPLAEGSPPTASL